MPILCNIFGHMYVILIWIILPCLSISLFKSEDHKFTTNVWVMVIIDIFAVIVTIIFFWLVWLSSYLI